MGFSTITMICIFFFLSSSSSADVFKVGGNAGWSLSKVDYANWTSQKTFHVGDTLMFRYKAHLHTVTRVMTKAAFDSCNSSPPVASYASGHDIVAIKYVGDHYFICDSPGHCELGQKLHVLALPNGCSPSLPPYTAPSNSMGSSGNYSWYPNVFDRPSAAPAIYKNSGLVVFTLAVVAILIRPS